MVLVRQEALDARELEVVRMKTDIVNASSAARVRRVCRWLSGKLSSPRWTPVLSSTRRGMPAHP